MDYVRQLLEYERNFDGHITTNFIAQHIEIPVFSVCLYLAVVFYLPEQLKNHKGFSLRVPFALWNLGLSLFSIIGASRSVPVLTSALWNDGFRYTCCQDPFKWYGLGPVGLWMSLFAFSKIPELGDTVFLVLQKKPVIFLHWFHHTTVLLYCWHAYLTVVAPGLWFATMNYCVHSVMYFYYFLMSVGFRGIAKRMAPFITTFQLLQMVMGSTVTAVSGYWYYTEGNCAVDPANFRLGLAMYSSYFVLFAILFRNLYCVGPGREGGKGGRGSGGKGVGGASSAGSAADGQYSSKNPYCCGVEVKSDAAGFFSSSGRISQIKVRTVCGAIHLPFPVLVNENLVENIHASPVKVDSVLTICVPPLFFLE